MLPSQYRKRWGQREADRRARPAPPPQPPARRDIAAAHVYLQTWRNGGTEIGFPVLALDADDADIQGGIRLAAMGNDAREWRNVENREVADASLELICGVLDTEDVEEREHREASFRRREEEPGEPNLNGVSARERIDAGYDAMRERRR